MKLVDFIEACTTARCYGHDVPHHADHQGNIAPSDSFFPASYDSSESQQQEGAETVEAPCSTGTRLDVS